MATARKMTRLVQIGLSHSDKANMLAQKGIYDKAIEELVIALDAFSKENSDGSWDDTIAGILNNIGVMSLFIGDFEGSANALSDALELKRKFSDESNILGTIIALADAYRGVCEFELAGDCLEEAFNISLRLKKFQLASNILDGMDSLERTRSGSSAPGTIPLDIDELYIPASCDEIFVKINGLKIEIKPSGKIKIKMILGFPELEGSWEEYIAINNEKGTRVIEKQIPFLIVLVDSNKDISIDDLEVIDEEESFTASSILNICGNIYSPSSYNRNGPMPIPRCKSFKYINGKGHILGLEASANGWYSINIEMHVDNGPKGLEFAFLLPFKEVDISGITINSKKLAEYKKISLESGTFFESPYEVAGSMLKSLKFLKLGTVFTDSLPGSHEVDEDIALNYPLLNLKLK